MKNRMFVLSLGLVALVATGCKQNPLPTDGQLLRDKPATKEAVMPPLLLEMPESVDFFEGKPGEIDIKASVPAPGVPIVTIEGLPEGALFNAATGKLTWTPSFTAANDERDPRTAERAYPLRVQIASSENTKTVSTRPLVILVRDIPRAFTIEYPKPAVLIPPVPTFPPTTTPLYIEGLDEGTTIEREVVIKSEDFPGGTFDLRAQGLPEGASLRPKEAGKFEKWIYTYSPGTLTVDYSPDLNPPPVIAADGSVMKNVEFIATDPAGRISKVLIGFKVMDKRMDSQVTAPDLIEEGTDLSFTIRADDLNGEVPPKIIPKNPEFGTFGVKRVKEEKRGRNNNPWASKFVRWTDIPEDKVGTSSELVFSVCVQKNKNNYEYCKDHTVKVNFVEKPQPAPLVDRKAFPPGITLYVKQNDKVKVALPVRGREVPTPATPVVSVTPAEEGISWKSNQLSIEPTTTGKKPFILLAKSPFGGSVAESFLVEVLPWSWSANLILGESPLAAEVARMQSFIEADIANAQLMLGNDLAARTLALRDLLVVGTGGMVPKEVLGSVEAATTQVKNVVVLSPLVELVTGPLLTELKDLKVAFKSRVRNIADYTLEVTGTSLQKPAEPIKLAGTLSVESDEPLPLDLSQVAAGKCEPLLKLVKTGVTPVEELIIAAKCQRKTGGTLVVSGVEWADIELANADRTLIKKWMTNLGLVKP